VLNSVLINNTFYVTMSFLCGPSFFALCNLVLHFPILRFRSPRTGGALTSCHVKRTRHSCWRSCLTDSST